MISEIADQLLQHTAHRPYPAPRRRWLIYQEWKDNLFLHLPVAPEQVQSLIPRNCRLDIIEGKAWLSLVLFAVTDARLHLLPSMPLLPAFNEINVRTYVQFNNIPGIYFLRIKAASRIAVLMNRLMTKLPYRLTNLVRMPSYRYIHQDKEEGNMLEIGFVPAGPVNEPSQLDRWLTERYCCYQDEGPKLYRYDIHHGEWPLYQVETNIFKLQYNLPGLPMTASSVTLLHYSPLQPALIWQYQRVL
jgi:uncharacterized protein YqjF (DUF2071 family)